MKLTSKEFKLFGYTENRNEWIIMETFYILNYSLYYTYHYESGDTPFKDFFAAKDEQDRLMKKEQKERINRELKIIWSTVIVLLTVVFGALYKYL